MRLNAVELLVILPRLQSPCLVKMRKDLKIYSLPFIQTRTHVHTTSSWHRKYQRASLTKMCGTVQNPVFWIGTAKKPKWVLKLVMHWREWLQECRKSLAGGSGAVLAAAWALSAALLPFSCCLCHRGQHGQRETLLMKHPTMFYNSVLVATVSVLFSQSHT